MHLTTSSVINVKEWIIIIKEIKSQQKRENNEWIRREREREKTFLFHYDCCCCYSFHFTFIWWKWYADTPRNKWEKKEEKEFSHLCVHDIASWIYCWCCFCKEENSERVCKLNVNLRENLVREWLTSSGRDEFWCTSEQNKSRGDEILSHSCIKRESKRFFKLSTFCVMNIIIIPYNLYSFFYYISKYETFLWLIKF